MSFLEKMEKWMIAAKKADFNEIAAYFQIDPVTARLIRNRDIVGEACMQEYLYGNLGNLHNPVRMKDMEKAIGILETKIKQEKRIRIIGDYDIDGIMSAYVLHCGLKNVGARADIIIPHRITDGYGINQDLIEQAAADGIDTIITCDNGIAAAAQIAVARELGITVIVTDHHEVPYEEDEAGNRQEILPPAQAILNPKQQECSYPFKHLCGAGVAYKLVTELYRYFGLEDTLHEELLEYTAIATIGDVMDLVGENRILVKEGLRRLQHTSNIGLQELIKVNSLVPENVSPYHIGFVLGPCLNATGRLDTAQLSLKLLWAQQREEAAKLAGDLKNLNESRKEMTLQGVSEGIRMVEETSLSEDRVLVVYLPDCHESLAGIIAGRLRERYHKPTLVLTRTEACVKGSGRSIEAYSMYEELVKCKDLLSKFGGHPMAAGLSLEEENVPRLRKKLNQCCRLTPDDLVEKVTIDVAMPISYVHKGLIAELELLQPFGKGNTKPLFAQKDIKVLNCRIFGKNNNVVKMRIMDEKGFAMDAVYFGEGETFVERVRESGSLSIIYYPSINVYQGKETLQIVISHYQ